MKRLFQIVIVFVLSAVMSAQLMAQSGYEPETYNYKRAVEAINEENYSEAFDYLKKELADNPKDGYAYAWVAALYYMDDSYGDALTYINKAIKYLPSKDSYWIALSLSQRGDVYLKIADTAAALKDYTEAIKICKDEEKLQRFYSDRAQLYYELREYDLSNEDYEQIVNLDEGGATGHLGQARNLIALRQYEKAIEKLDHVVRMHSDNSRVYSFRAEAYMRMHRYSEAADDIISALDIDADNKAWVLLQMMADSSFSVMNTKLRVRAAKQPQADNWQFYLATINEIAKRYDDAIAYYSKAHTLSPNDVFASSMGDCYKKKGDFQQAIRYYSEAMDLDSTDYRHLLNRAKAEYSAGLYDDAIADYDRLIEESPDAGGFYYWRGWVKEHGLSDIEGAIDDYTTCITLVPEYAYAYMNRGILYRLQGKTALARADFQKALELDTVVWPYDCAHFCYLYLGQRDSAVAVNDRLLRYDRSANLYDAACLYSIMGDKEQGLSFLRESLDSGYVNINHIQHDRDLDNLRSMPEYKALIDKYSKYNTTSEAVGSNPQRTVTTEVPFTRENGGGTCKVQCSINGLPLNMIFDTGADDISLSSVEAAFMFKNGYLSSKDVIGRTNYLTASGEVVEGTIINLSKIEFGGLQLSNVRASVVKGQRAPLLLGQSVLSRLGKIEIDNVNRKLIITHAE
ncbi:MAG: tetratricopeptide repeat protein [Bacteroidales bacterium]|nr:tetratricopeptide repeat protein [Bacteroidales bacterium]